MSKIFTDKDWLVIESKKCGDHRDKHGTFSNQTRGKIAEVLELAKTHGKLFRWLLKPKKRGEKYKG
jgi:hypothetical protein